MKLVMDRQVVRTLGFLLAFAFVWTQSEHVSDFFVGFFEGYERTLLVD